ncbi:protein SHOOT GRAVITROPISM 6 isoform X1 [Iris pallida]|uniref:Protein SHOOT GRAVITROPISM 6 isoform X1 n=1 Tax=Iris pallida TaxID=29817 RepID=A0AAX6DZB2_IRIPA|nr:protein SHOOT GRAVITROPISM 6 isoform X1 [Iris pallida]
MQACVLQLHELIFFLACMCLQLLHATLVKQSEISGTLEAVQDSKAMKLHGKGKLYCDGRDVLRVRYKFSFTL